MPGFDFGQTVAICDSRGERIGDLQIYELRIGAWCGTFCAAPAYDRVRHLFAKHAELATRHSVLMDEAAKEIAALGLWARIGSERYKIRDVRIYENATGAGASFREVA